MKIFAVMNHDPESSNPPPPRLQAVAATEDAAKRWIQNEVDGIHNPCYTEYMQGKTADWWISYGTFSIREMEVVKK